MVPEPQKCHPYHHSFSPNFLVLGKASFVSGNVKSRYLPPKIGKNVANFFESVSDMSDEEDERKPPAKRCHDGQVDNGHSEINIENKKSRQMHYN